MGVIPLRREGGLTTEARRRGEGWTAKTLRRKRDNHGGTKARGRMNRGDVEGGLTAEAPTEGRLARRRGVFFWLTYLHIIQLCSDVLIKRLMEMSSGIKQECCFSILFEIFLLPNPPYKGGRGINFKSSSTDSSPLQTCSFFESEWCRIGITKNVRNRFLTRRLKGII